MEIRYRALRTIGTIYKVLGGIAGIITIVLVLIFCASSVLGGAALSNLTGDLGNGSSGGGLLGGVLGGVFISLLTILYGGTVAVSLYGFGEGIYLLLALEENTRATAQLLRSQMQQS